MWKTQQTKFSSSLVGDTLDLALMTTCCRVLDDNVGARIFIFYDVTPAMVATRNYGQVLFASSNHLGVDLLKEKEYGDEVIAQWYDRDGNPLMTQLKNGYAPSDGVKFYACRSVRGLAQAFLSSKPKTPAKLTYFSDTDFPVIKDVWGALRSVPLFWLGLQRLRITDIDQVTGQNTLTAILAAAVTTLTLHSMLPDDPDISITDHLSVGYAESLVKQTLARLNE